MRKSPSRAVALRRMLSERRHELQGSVQRQIRGGRDRPTGGGDDLETTEANNQEDLERSLVQMRASTLKRIDEALVRLDAGQYGTCAECETAISERRLRALPFAVRCQSCEERQEALQGHTQRLTQRRSSFPLFVDGFGS